MRRTAPTWANHITQPAIPLASSHLRKNAGICGFKMPVLQHKTARSGLQNGYFASPNGPYRDSAGCTSRRPVTTTSAPVHHLALISKAITTAMATSRCATWCHCKSAAIIVRAQPGKPHGRAMPDTETDSHHHSQCQAKPSLGGALSVRSGRLRITLRLKPRQAISVRAAC